MNRLADLAHAHPTAPTPKATPAPKGYTPGIEYEHGKPAYINTPPAPHVDTPDGYAQILETFGWPLPAGSRLELVSAAYDPAAWHRDEPFTGDPLAPNQKQPAVTRPVWRYRLRVVYDQAGITAGDVEAMVKALTTRTVKRTTRPPKADAAYVVAIADAQAGKAMEGPDADQGSEQMLERVFRALDIIATDIKRVRPAHIVILDPGDAIENMFNTSVQGHSNDLALVEQVRVWSRILMRYVRHLFPLAPKLTVAAVPSNHGEVRSGPKSPQAGPFNDFGLLAASTVQDAVELGLPGADIDFAYPRRGEDSLTIEAAGTKLGVAHGHHVNNPDRQPDWITKQIAGRRPLEAADVVVTGHFHSLRIQKFAGDRTWVQCPSADGGSQWFTRGTGNYSAPGILTFLTANGRVWDIRVN